MRPGVQMIVGAAADFVGALGTAVTAAMIHAGEVVVPGKGVWILGVITGAMAAASHVKASLTAPPPKPGGGG